MIRPPLSGWLGGKYLLSKQIVQALPEHGCYVEVFAGAAWVLFRKPPSRAEVLNDINEEVVNLYRVIRHHRDAFVDSCRWLLVSREEFESFIQVDPGTMTDIQRAVRFYYLQKASFGGRILDGRPTFGTSAILRSKLNLASAENDLAAVHRRLARVTIEHLPYHQVIRRYDRPATLFYLDPPYYGCEGYYGEGVFAREDFSRMADQLARIQGKFILSLNDTPEVREIFQAFRIEGVRTRYTASQNANNMVVQELLISNFR